MNKVYTIVISKRGKKIPEVGAFLKKVFTLTWRLASNKHNETWLCGREEEANINDIITTIKGLNKKINGVVMYKISIESIYWDKDGYYDEPKGGILMVS